MAGRAIFFDLCAWTNSRASATRQLLRRSSTGAPDSTMKMGFFGASEMISSNFFWSRCGIDQLGLGPRAGPRGRQAMGFFRNGRSKQVGRRGGSNCVNGGLTFGVFSHSRRPEKKVLIEYHHRWHRRAIGHGGIPARLGSLRRSFVADALSNFGTRQSKEHRPPPSRIWHAQPQAKKRKGRCLPAAFPFSIQAIYPPPGKLQKKMANRLHDGVNLKASPRKKAITSSGRRLKGRDHFPQGPFPMRQKRKERKGTRKPARSPKGAPLKHQRRNLP